MAEIWDLVDSNGESAGVRLSRSDRDKIPVGLYLPCVEVWVRVADKLLLTKRHPEKSEGLKYECPGGAAVSGENFKMGAARELFEEVGIKAEESELDLLGSVTEGDVYAVSYLLTLDALPEITLQPTEVVGYLLVDRDGVSDILDSLTRGTSRRYLLYRDKIFGRN